MFKRFILLFVILFSGYSIYAVGWHSASEILPGAFNSGNFSFDGNVDINGDICLSSGNCLSNVSVNIPVNAIMSFNQDSCPDGWIPANGSFETPDLRGIFVRGAGTSGSYFTSNGNAFSGGSVGNYINDSFQGHFHNTNNANSASGERPDLVMTGSSGTGPVQISGGATTTHINSRYITSPRADTVNGDTRTGSETAPASYSLIYCMKISSMQNNTHILKKIGSSLSLFDINDNVGIGTDSPSSKLHVVGVITETSDARLKKNVSIIKNSLKKISRINGVSFAWINESRMDSKTHLGIIAQNVESEFPELVFTGEDGFKSVNYDGFVAPFVEAIKELKTENDLLKNELCSKDNSYSWC